MLISCEIFTDEKKLTVVGILASAHTTIKDKIAEEITQHYYPYDKKNAKQFFREYYQNFMHKAWSGKNGRA